MLKECEYTNDLYEQSELQHRRPPIFAQHLDYHQRISLTRTRTVQYCEPAVMLSPMQDLDVSVLEIVVKSKAEKR